MKKAFLFLLLIGIGCKHKAVAPVIHIALVNTARSLKITGIDDAIVQEINRDSVSWQSLIPIYRMPADTDMKDYQKPQPGKYVVMDSVVLFTPDTPFLQHQTYFVRFYQFEQGSTPMDYIKNDNKVGHQPYIDLIFKQ